VGFWGWFVDPRVFGDAGGGGRLPEPFGSVAVGGVEDDLACRGLGVGAAHVDVGGGQQGDAGVVMVVVVVIEEAVDEGSSLGDVGEAFREGGRVLEGLEVRFAVGVVVGLVGPAVGLQHAEIGEQLGDGLGGHGAAAVGVDGELSVADAVVVDGVGDELFGEGGRLAGRDEPGDGVAAVDVEDHVEVEPRPFVGAGQFGDVP